MFSCRKWMLILLVIVLSTAGLPACRADESTTDETVQYEGDLTQALAVQATAGQYLAFWQAEDYESMYGMLSTLSRDANSLKEFSEIYQDIANTITLVSMDVETISAMADMSNGQVAYRVKFHTMLVGDLTTETLMNLVREGSDWRVQWEIGMILPELRGGNHLEFVHQIPARGRIYDRDGAPLAAYEDAIAVGLVPGQLLVEQVDQIYATLAEIGPYTAEDLADLVDRTPDDWLLPVTTLSQEELAPYLDVLRGLSESGWMSSVSGFMWMAG